MGDGPDRKKYQADSPEVEARKKKDRAEHNRKRLEAEQRYVLGRGNQRDGYYAMLGVGRDASQSEIKKAYRALSNLFHPDRIDGDKTKSDAIIKELNVAFEAVGKSENREAYDRYGAEGVRNAERDRIEAERLENIRLEREAQEKQRQFSAWSDAWFDGRRPTSVNVQILDLLRKGKTVSEVREVIEPMLEEKLKLIPHNDHRHWKEILEKTLDRMIQRFKDEQGGGARSPGGAGAGGAGARAGGDPGRGGDAERERARREYAEKKRAFDAMFDGWTTDANEGSLFKDTLNLLEGGYSFKDATLAAGRDFDSVFNKSGVFVGDRPEYIRRMNEALERARVAYEAKRAGNRGGAGAGAGDARGGDAGGARERADREREEKEHKRKEFEKIMESLLSEKSPVGFYAEALDGFRRGSPLRSVRMVSEAMFANQIKDYRSAISDAEQLAYKAKIEEVIGKAERFYQDERDARDRAYREAEGRNLKDFTARFDQWMTKTDPKSLFVENWGKLKAGVPLADVIASIRAELADGFAKQRIPFALRASFEQRVDAAILELQRDFQADQGKERKRVEFRGRADQFIRENPEYIERNLGHISPDGDAKALVVQLKVLSLKVLNEMIAEYPEITPQEAQKYRTALEQSIDNSAAAFEKKKPKDKGREASEAWFSGVEEAAYQALKGGEPYHKVLARIKAEAAARVASAPAEKQQRFIDKAEAAVDKGFTKNEKEKKGEYAKWSKPWFDGLRAACEAGLDNGVAPNAVKAELRRMLDAKVGILPRAEDRDAEVRRMNTTVDAVIEQWQKKPGKEKAAGEKERAEKAAAEAWLTTEATQKIREILLSGMTKDETDKVVRAILGTKTTTLTEADRKPFLDRLATLVTVEYARYEQDKKREPTEAEKNRAEFEGWVRPWLSRLAGSCRSWLEGRKFEGGNWVPLNQKYDSDKVKVHVRKTLEEKLALIPRGEHATYIERVDEIIAAAIALDTWKRSLPMLCQPMLMEGKPFSEIRKDIEGKLVSMLTMVSADQHAAYRKGVDEALTRLEELHKENERRRGDMNDFLKSVFGDGKK